MTLLDELLVKLKIDSSGFDDAADKSKKGLDGVSKSADETSTRFKVMREGITKVRNELLLLFGLQASIGGAANYTKETIRQTDAQGFLADSIGMSTLRLKAYEAAATRAGGSSEAMAAALKKAATEAAAMRQGTMSLNEVDPSGLLRRYSGMDPAEITKSGETLLRARLQVYEKLRNARPEQIGGADPHALATKLAEEAGLTSGVLNAVMKQGVSGFYKNIGEQEKTLAPLANLEEQARRTQAAMADLNQQFDILGQMIVMQAVAPEMERVAKALKSMTPEERQAVVDAIKDLIANLDKMAVKLYEIATDPEVKAFFTELTEDLKTGAEKVDTVVKATVGWETALKVLIALPVLSWLAGLAAGFATLATGILGVGSAATAALAALVGFAAYKAAPVIAEKAVEMLPEDQQKWVKENWGTEDSTNAGGGVSGWIGKNIANNMALLGNDEAKEAYMTNENPTITGSKKTKMLGVYSAMTKAGFSPAQARAMTAEVGRENDYQDQFLYGTHTDAANKATNIGMISWQGDRAEKLRTRLEAKGLMKNGKMVRSQEALDAQAEFMMEELKSGQYSGVGDFLEDKDVRAQKAAKQLGKGYVKWAYGQDVLRSGEAFDWQKHDAKRATYAEEIRAMTASNKENQPANSQPVQERKPSNVNLAPPVAQSATVIPPALAGETPNHAGPRNVSIGQQVFNIKASDPEGVKKEVANKSLLTESMTQDFNSGVK